VVECVELSRSRKGNESIQYYGYLVKSLSESFGSTFQNESDFALSTKSALITRANNKGNCNAVLLN